MAALRPILVGLLIMGAFAIALISFMYGWIGTNNPSSDVLLDTRLNDTQASFISNLNDASNTTSNAFNKASNAQASPIYLFLIFEAALSIPQSFMSLAKSSLDLLTATIFSDMLGGGGAFSFAFSLISIIMILTIVFLLIKYIRTGEGER